MFANGLFTYGLSAEHFTMIPCKTDAKDKQLYLCFEIFGNKIE